MYYTENGYGIFPPDEWEEIKLIDYDTGIYVYLGKDHVTTYLNFLIYDEKDFTEDNIKVSKEGNNVKLTLSYVKDKNKNRISENEYLVTDFYKEQVFLLTEEDLEKMLRMFDGTIND